MKINQRILNLSAWLALSTLVVFPGDRMIEGTHRTEYGYPIRYFTQYHNYENESQWFMAGIYFDLLAYLFDVLIIYALLHVLFYLKNKLRAANKNSHSN